MGIVHGGWCIGCCWALMAALFALGVMSLGWMAFIAALIAVEKLVPWKAVANRGIAVLLLVLGLAVALTPASVPGLTLPGSAGGDAGMEGLDGGSMGRMDEGSMGEGSMNEGSMGERLDGRRLDRAAARWTTARWAARWAQARAPPDPMP